MGTTPVASAVTLDELKADIRTQQESGTLKQLAAACCALLTRADGAAFAPDPEAVDLLARILLLGSAEVDPGRIVAMLRPHPAILTAIAAQADALLEQESAENRTMLIGLFNLSLNRFGFLVAQETHGLAIVDISKAPYRPDEPPEPEPVHFDEGVIVNGSASAGQRFKIVTFYTAHNEYAQFAQRLNASLQAHRVYSELHAIHANGPWEFICASKARFVLECWEASDCAVVWIDADATVEQYPALFDTIDADFAIHKWSGYEFGSGTIYFGKTDTAHRLLKQWVLRCEADPVTWDQVHLQSAWCDLAATVGVRSVWLPRSYLQIFDAPELEAPVIKHWQASRVLKADGRVTGLAPLHYTTSGEQLRRSEQPWRSAESSFWIDEGVGHIIPHVGAEFPEGFDVGLMLRASLDGCLPVLEVGCGVGRIAQLFTPSEYIGVDINPHALIAARQANPQHLFRIADVGLAFPQAPAAMLYTVLLHVADADIEGVLAAVVDGRERVVIAELMDSRWRREGNPPVFNRDPETYIELMRALGFGMVSFDKKEYERYAQEPFNVGKDSRLTSLVFDRLPGY